MGFQRVTKKEILNHCFLRRLLIHERDNRQNDQLDKLRLRLYAFQHQKVYWSDKLTFALWELAPNDHLKHIVFISLLSLNICRYRGKTQNGTDKFILPCLTDSFFFSSTAVFPYAIDINAKMAIKVKTKFIVFSKKIILVYGIRISKSSTLMRSTMFTRFIAFNDIGTIHLITDW